MLEQCCAVAEAIDCCHDTSPRASPGARLGLCHSQKQAPLAVQQLLWVAATNKGSQLAARHLHSNRTQRTQCACCGNTGSNILCEKTNEEMP